MTERLTTLPDRDITARLCEQVSDAFSQQTPLRIVGGNTRAFYGRPVNAAPLNVAEHRGIVHYDPVELVVTVRAGTPLDALEAAQVVADLDTWSWEDRQGAVGEWDDRIARVRDLFGGAV